MRRVVTWVGMLVVLVWIALTAWVEREAEYKLESQASAGRRALVLYHPSREARFSDDLSMAVTAGLQSAGFSVDRATITERTAARPDGYQVVFVVSNTYNWAPDWPTMQYLKRANFEGINVVGLIGGAGSTGRSERILGEALRGTGAKVLGTRSLWLWRPNDETRMEKPNREVGLDIARRFAADVSQGVR